MSPVSPLHEVQAQNPGFVEGEAPAVPVQGKKPTTGWKRRMRTTTRDWQTWILRYPNASGAALVTGSRAGVTVLDEDEAGAVDRLFADVGESVPRTPVCRTGGGGRHFYFRYVPGLASSTKPVPGIDVRGDGGIVVLPGSIHAETGCAYQWETSPQDTPLAELPDAVVQALIGGNRGHATPSGGLLTAQGRIRESHGPARASGSAIPIGCRNTAIFAAACSLRGRGTALARAEQEILRLERTTSPRYGEDAALSVVRRVYAEYPAGGRHIGRWLQPPMTSAEERAFFRRRKPYIRLLLRQLRRWQWASPTVRYSRVSMQRALKLRYGLHVSARQSTHGMKVLAEHGFVSRPIAHKARGQAYTRGYYEVMVAAVAPGLAATSSLGIVHLR